MTPREGENRFGEIVWEPSYHPLVSDRRGGGSILYTITGCP